MLNDLLKAEAARLLAQLDETPEPKKRDDLRRNKHKRLQFKDGMAFHCRECGCQFDADWSLITTEPDADSGNDTPQYYAQCPQCEAQAPNAHWYKAMFKSWQRSKSDPELNAQRAKAFDGTRTPEQNAISRFNGYVHGAYAKSKHLFPNVPGSKWCIGCDIDPDYCRANPGGACVKAAEAYMLRHLSIEKGDPSLLNRLIATNQANADVLFNMMTQDLITSGVKYSKPEYVNGEAGPQIVRDDEGNPIRLDYVNPLLPYWQKHLAIMNQTPIDTLTAHRVAVREDDTAALFNSTEAEKETLEKILEDQAEAIKGLAGLISASQVKE